MKTLVIVLLSCSVLFTVGCSGGGSSPSMQVQARLNSNGVFTAWPSATIYGTAVNYGCSGSDQGCITQFTQAADTNGNLTVTTDALPADWDFQLYGDSYCPQGAQTGFLQVNSTEAVPVVCGQPSSDLAANPMECEQRYTNGGNVLFSTTCPSSVPLTAVTNQLSTAHALDVSDYDQNANYLGGTSVMATSPTAISVPLPAIATDPNTGLPIANSSPGEQQFMIIRDPTTNDVVGSASILIKVYVSGTDK